MQPPFLINRTFELSTVYSILLLILYIINRDATIPLTYRIPMYDWGSLEKLIETDPVHLNQTQFRKALWCKGPDTSPQCNCMYDFHSGPNTTFVRNAEAFLAGKGPANTKELAKNQYTDLISACLSQRTSWRKETCDYWCRVHLTTPVGLACLFTCIFFSRIAKYESRLLQMIAKLTPLGLSLLTVAAHIGIDLAGGVVAALSVLSALAEVSLFSCTCVEQAQVYWNHLRFVAATLAVWAAVTQQARDVYLIGCYGTLGFALGLLAYTQYLMRYRQGCNSRVRVVALYVWIGMCVISACFLLLLQQHLYPSSPMWSSVASGWALVVTCAQCISNMPGISLSDTVQIGVTLAVLSFCTFAATWDIYA